MSSYFGESYMQAMARAMNAYRVYSKILNIGGQLSPKEYGIAIQNKRNRKKKRK